MINIHILTNPLSGKNRKQPTRFDTMMSVAKSNCAPENSLTCHQPKGLDALLESVRTIKASGADVLCIDGGDGTIHQVFTALWNVYGDETPYPKIAFLKGGTMNNIARNVGIPFTSTATSFLRQLVSNAPLQTTIRHPLILRSDSGTERSGFIYGNAALAPFMQDYYEGAPPSPLKGFLMFCRVTLSSLFGGPYSQYIMPPVEMDVYVNGTRLSDRVFTLIGVSTVADVGFYCRPFYHTLTNHNILHMLGMTCSPLNIVKVIPLLWLAKPTRKPYIKDIVSTEIRFEYAKPHISTIDGDMIPASTVDTVQVGPPVQFIHP